MNDKQQLSKVPYLPGTSEGISSEQIRDFVEDNEEIYGSVLLTDFIATVLVTNSILSFKFPNMWAG